jgi:predicted phosphodiesterase
LGQVPEFTRVISDLHYGDRASRAHTLAQLKPLADGVDRLVFNGDTLDTRPGPRPQHTADCRTALLAFAGENVKVSTFLTGNHDPDFSTEHVAVLAGGKVIATHGDIVFDDIVPWGRDAREIRRRIAAALGPLSAAERGDLAKRFAIWRRVAASIPQRHQSEPHGLKYALWFAADTVWPPLRVLRILDSWRIHAPRVAGFARQHWPAARFVIIGHTHRPAIHRFPDGLVVINTGSFCPPLGGFAVDLAPGALTVRRVALERGEFRSGETVAQFAL